MEPCIGVVADDVTGAGDIGLMFTHAGLAANVYNKGHLQNADVHILNTASRTDSPALAAQKVKEATRSLLRAGAVRLYNKTCSVFRGNIGAEFDAMLEERGVEYAPVVLAFPDNGRTTVNGVHYVHGQRVQDSPFRDDPVNPMRLSHLGEIIGLQSKRPCHHITLAQVRGGRQVLQQAYCTLKEQKGYIIFDAETNDDLAAIAAVIYKEPVVCGASAIARYTGALLAKGTATASAKPPPPACKGRLVVAGSLTPDTRAQVAWCKTQGATLLELPTRLAGDEEEFRRTAHTLAQSAAGAVVKGETVVVHTTNTPKAIALQKKAMAGQAPDYSRRIAQTLAEIAESVIGQTGLRHIVVAGGETSGAFCTRMGIDGMRVLGEIQPGLPACLSFTQPPLCLVLKSGSFGDESFFTKALDYFT